MKNLNKKICNILKKTVEYCVCYLILYLLFIFKFFTNYSISIVTPYRIGHLVGEIDQYLRTMKLKDKFEKKLIITGRACNKTVVKIFSSHV